MVAVKLLLFVALLSLSYSQIDTTPGGALYYAKFENDYAGIITQGSANEWSQLSTTFTIEFWMMDLNVLPGIQSVINRHPSNGFESFEKSHFHLQIVRTPSQYVLEAKVGCTVGVGYSLNAPIPAATLATSSRWNHYALVVNGTSSASLYVNGALARTTGWNWAECSRSTIFWQSTTRDVMLGYWNSPSGVQRFNGTLDELRFWTTALTQSQISVNRQVSLSSYNNSELIAYFKFNEGPSVGLFGTPIVQSFFTSMPTPTNLNPRAVIDFRGGPVGRFVDNRIVPGGVPVTSSVRGPPHSLPSTPDMYPPVLQEVISMIGRNPGRVTPLPSNNIILSAIATNGSTSGFSFYLDSITGGLWSAMSAGTAQLVTSAGWLIPSTVSSFPVLLPSGNLTIKFSCSTSSCAAISGSTIGYSARFRSSDPFRMGIITIQASIECPSSAYDACGVCNGDNSTCSCGCYRGFRAPYLDYSLATFAMNQTRTEIDKAIEILATTIAQLKKYQPGKQPSTFDIAAAAFLQKKVTINQLGCLWSYCNSVAVFNRALAAVSPLPEPTQLPYDLCSCNPNTSRNS